MINCEELDIAVLLEKFQEKYSYLYEYKGRPEGYDAAVKEGDRILVEEGDLIHLFTIYRGDLITSDRETAALAMALREVPKLPDGRRQEYVGRWDSNGTVFEIFRMWGGGQKDHLECFIYPEGKRSLRTLYAQTTEFICHMDFLLYCMYNLEGRASA